MSFPRKKLDMSLLILEERSCEVIEACARKFDPAWDFNRFEAIQCNAADPEPADGNRYDASYIFHIAGPALDMLDREVPFLFPLERGTHYLWELFTELPRSGGSRSSRQFWNRLARAMSPIELPITAEDLVAHFEEAALTLLEGAVDLGDRFYIPNMDFGGWNGGIVSKDFLIEGLKMLAAKLDGPVREKRKVKHTTDEAEPGAKASGDGAADAGAGEKTAETSAKDDAGEKAAAGAESDSAKPADGDADSAKAAENAAPTDEEPAEGETAAEPASKEAEEAVEDPGGVICAVRDEVKTEEDGGEEKAAEDSDGTNAT